MLFFMLNLLFSCAFLVISFITFNTHVLCLCIIAYLLTYLQHTTVKIY